VTALVAAICGVFGLVVGSFLNVVIWRVPRHESIVHPPSHCPACEAPIKPYDNIPVVSWLALRGHCRNCGVHISFRYPFIELLTGVLFVAVGAVYHDSWALPAFLVLTAGLIALSAIDLESMLLPLRIVYPVLYASLVLLALASLGEHDWSAYLRGLAGALVAFAFFLTVHLIKPNGMGGGDVRLSALLGLNLGWLGWGFLFGGLFTGFLYGAAVGIGMMVALGAKARKMHIPFGPFLAAGTLTFILVGEQILDWYRGLGR
jgi:leader peptidase (prepilin peptidase) / N-methyltransferase